MEKEERQRLKDVADEISGWAKRAASLVKDRQNLTDEQLKAAQALMARVFVRGDRRMRTWRTLNLTPGDGEMVTALARGHLLPTDSADGGPPKTENSRVGEAGD